MVFTEGTQDKYLDEDGLQYLTWEPEKARG